MSNLEFNDRSDEDVDQPALTAEDFLGKDSPLRINPVIDLTMPAAFGAPMELSGMSDSTGMWAAEQENMQGQVADLMQAVGPFKPLAVTQV